MLQPMMHLIDEVNLLKAFRSEFPPQVCRLQVATTQDSKVVKLVYHSQFLYYTSTYVSHPFTTMDRRPTFLRWRKYQIIFAKYCRPLNIGHDGCNVSMIDMGPPPVASCVT
jgi:hypothetical protein